MTEKSEIIQCYYKKSEFIKFVDEYYPETVESMNKAAFELIGLCPLYSESTTVYKKIQFNTIKVKSFDSESYFNVTENICLQFSNNNSLFGLNYYKSNVFDGSYENNAKYIFEIISGTGIYLGATGYIVIDVIGDRRNVTIKIIQ